MGGKYIQGEFTIFEVFDQNLLISTSKESNELLEVVNLKWEITMGEDISRICLA